MLIDRQETLGMNEALKERIKKLEAEKAKTEADG
jgi:hypothetical protein